MAQAVAGTALVAGGAAALNQFYERDTDALMRRTRLAPAARRPRVAGRRARSSASRCRSPASCCSPCAPTASAALALATLVVYLVVYTPMKRRTPLSTLVGAVPGALPPLIGWTASHGSIALGGATLFAIVFLWQIPHFMAIAWMYRDDYAKAGFPMLPVIDPEGTAGGAAGGAIRGGAAAGSLLPTLVGHRRPVYFAVGAGAQPRAARLAVRFAATRSDGAARALFFGSITYLPLIWIVMIANRCVTVHDLPAVNASLNALSGVLLLFGYCADPGPADRAAPGDDRSVRRLVAVPRLLRRLPRAGGVGAASRGRASCARCTSPS